MPKGAGAAPKISVITAVRNGGELFRRTVESVVAQTYEGLEYIVIDGGSTDGTLEVIRQNAARVDRWVSEPDRGIAEAFNKGVAVATGDYLLFLNADDRLVEPNAMTRLVAAFAADAWPDLVYGDCRVVSRATRRERYVASITFDPVAFRRGAMLPHPSLLMHRSYFERFGLYDTSFRIAMDFEILLRGAPSVRVLHIPTLVTEVSDGGVSTRDSGLVITEIVRAMRMHGVVKPGLSEWRTKARFHGRRLARQSLEVSGLYCWFARWRDSRSRSH